MKIGTMVHVVRHGQQCDVGFVTEDLGGDEIAFVALGVAPVPTLPFTFGERIRRDPSAADVGEREATWHSADECRWHR